MSKKLKNIQSLQELLECDADFIEQYCKASNASTGSFYDANANVQQKNVVTLAQELPKGINIMRNRSIMKKKITELYDADLAEQYLKDLDSHVLYKHDESASAGVPYTYSAKEVIEVMYKGRHLLTPFDLLWETVEEDAVLVNEEDNVYQKAPSDLMVKDIDGYTKVTVMTKKERRRDLVRVKTAFGEDVVVTDNHPMIVDKDNVDLTVHAIDSEGQRQFKIDDELVFGGNSVVDTSACPGVEHFTEVYCMTCASRAFRRYVNLSEELGYFVGFFVGDGNYNNAKDNGSIVITQKEESTLRRLNDILFKEIGICGNIRYKRDKSRCFTLSVASDVLWWLLSEYFMIQDKSQHKTLPCNILETNEEFAKGVLAGLMDADGTVNDTQLSIRLSSRSAVLQATSLLRHFGYGVGNTFQSIPFSPSMTEIQQKYGVWGVNCSPRTNCVPFPLSYKLQRIQSACDSSLKYHKGGDALITNVSKVAEDDAFLALNDFIYDITTETHTFACNNLLVHNCVAITMYPFLTDGLTKIGGISTPPTDTKSYCGEFVNLVFSIASQFAGAVATPEFLMYMDYFLRKDYGEDYVSRIGEVVEATVKQRTLSQVIDNYFQQVVHSMNMPTGARGYQTVFWNIGYFDKPYFDGVFGDFRFPDGTAPKWETLSWLQKHFMNWFNEERSKYVLTFPVETMALLTDGKDDFVDKEYADFTAEMWSKGHSFFCYLSDSPDSLSSCCRLRNSISRDKTHNVTTHQYSMGTASVATGSKSVMTINLNRLVQDAFNNGDNCTKERTYANIMQSLDEMVTRVHKYQHAFNEILKDFYKAHMLPVYEAGFISMKKQYLTIGVNGLTDAAKFLNIEPKPCDEYHEFVNNILETINKCNRRDKTPDLMFNTEFVPGENLSHKNYEWDRKAGYKVSKEHNMYSSYFYDPEDTSLTIIDKFKLHGKDYVQYLDGGSALHMNLEEHLSKAQYLQLMKVAAHYKCNYFTYNVRNTVCNECGHISKNTEYVCPKCGSKNLDYLTRVIGYLKRVSNFSEARQQEANVRHYADGEPGVKVFTSKE